MEDFVVGGDSWKERKIKEEDREVKNDGEKTKILSCGLT